MAKKLGELVEKNVTVVTVRNEPIKINYLISDSGGQGDVYHATYRNHNYALKWYNKNSEDVIGSDQYNTIKRLTEMSSPGDEFVWPQVLVTESNPAPGKLFGYLMELIPSGYPEMKDYLRNSKDDKQVKFNSYNSMLMAGMNIASAMQKLHLKGLSYKDLNPNNFAMNPENGKVLVIDNDNVSVDGGKCTVKGMKGYMAPEIPRSRYQADPSRTTDFFSLAIILYRLFFIDHPMEGKRWEGYPMHTDKVEEYLYAIEPVFHFDINNDSNRPTEYFAPNAVSRWAPMPIEVKELFMQALTEGIDNPAKRPPENAWIRTISAVRDRLIRLPNGREQFVNFEDKRSIPARCIGMKINNAQIALYPSKGIYDISVTGNLHNYDKLVAGIVYDKASGRFMIRNLSGKVWKGYNPEDGSLTDIAKNQQFPVYPGVQIMFQSERPKIVGKIIEGR